MTITELWTNLRLWLNDSNSSTYLWTDAELVNYFNYVMDEIARDTDYFRDAATEAIVSITLSAGTPDYAYDSRIIEIRSVQVAGETSKLDKTTYNTISSEDDNWRYIVSLYANDLTFADNTPSADTIASSTTSFIDANIAADDWISIVGTDSNDGTFQVATVAEHLLTMKTTASLTNEASGDNVTIKVLNTDTPEKYLLDLRTGYLTLYPCPDEAGSLILECTVRDLVPLTTTSLALATYTIPISSQYHIQLMDAVMSKAYLKAGPSTFNAEKAVLYSSNFMALKSRIKRDLIRLRGAFNTASPHDGTL